jgi:hypothetical protein
MAYEKFTKLDGVVNDHLPAAILIGLGSQSASNPEFNPPWA